MNLEIMSKNHPRWPEFVTRLQGPEGCNFRDGAPHCGGAEAHHAIARRLLAEMGDINVEQSCAYFIELGACCDCEILANIERITSRLVVQSFLAGFRRERAKLGRAR